MKSNSVWTRCSAIILALAISVVAVRAEEKGTVTIVGGTTPPATGVEVSNSTTANTNVGWMGSDSGAKYFRDLGQSFTPKKTFDLAAITVQVVVLEESKPIAPAVLGAPFSMAIYKMNSAADGNVSEILGVYSGHLPETLASGEYLTFILSNTPRLAANSTYAFALHFDKPKRNQWISFSARQFYSGGGTIRSTDPANFESTSLTYEFADVDLIFYIQSSLAKAESAPAN